MKKSVVIVLLVLVAAASSAATLGAQKIIKALNAPEGIVIITDERCEDCDTTRIEAALKSGFPEAAFEVLDYGDRKGKKLYDAEGLDMLPAVLIPKPYSKQDSFKRFERFAKLGKGYYALATGGKFDPKAEVCDNGKDDNGDGLVDCSDPTCKKDWRCMEQRETPDVDVFVMSHCPYGTQIEKGLLPVWDMFGDKINLNLRFVDYAMHGKKEIDEQLKQYCIGQQGKGKLRNYLGCFLKSGEKNNTCDVEAKVDSGALSSCLKKADEEFGITKAFEDKSQWKGRFPPFPLHKDLAEKYGVRGSPTLVINDVVVKSGRSPKAIRDAICKGFKEKPAECEAKIDDSNPAPGFGSGNAKTGGGKGACGS